MMYKGLAAVVRCQPVHLGHAAMFNAMCTQAEQVRIGIGSANIQSYRNPFSAKERQDMIDAYLGPRFTNYGIVAVDDYGHIPAFHDGQRWRQEVNEKFQGIETIATGDAWAKELLHLDFKIVHPSEIIPREQWIKMTGKHVRKTMAMYLPTDHCVPPEVEQYLRNNDLADRFARQYGLETLAELGGQDTLVAETAEQEHQHVTGAYP